MGSSGALLETLDIIATGIEGIPPPPNGSGIYVQLPRSLNKGLSGIDGLHQVFYQSDRPYPLSQLIEPLALFGLLFSHPFLFKRTIDENSKKTMLFVLGSKLAIFFVFPHMGCPRSI
jgi:hypothetical protein